MINNNIVLPPEMLTKNLVNYNKLFSLGENIPGCKYNERYTFDNFVDFLPRQANVLNMINNNNNNNNNSNDDSKDNDEDGDDDDDDDYEFGDEDADADLQIPIFGRQKSPNSRAYEYTICSYRAIMKTEFVYVNMMLRLGIPLHFYADFDLSMKEMENEEGAPVKNVSNAIKEAIECMRIVIKEEQEVVRNPTFANVDGKFTLSILYGHRDDKESSHVVFHMTGLRMFEDVVSCRYFYYRLVLVNHRRYASKKDNPFYYKKAKTGEYICIMDNSVYSMNRMFRHIGQVKQGSKPYPNNGALYPDCGSPTLVCTNPTCMYHVYRQISETEFCVNDIRFVPRTSNGNPFYVDKLKIAKVPNPDSKWSKLDTAGENSMLSYITLGTNANTNTNSTMISPLFGNRQLLTSNAASRASANDNSENGGSEATMTAQQRSSAKALVNIADLGTHRSQIMSIVATMLSKKTGYKCQARPVDSKATNGEMTLIMCDSKMCPYNGKRHCSTYTPKNVVPLEHKSNHIFFNAFIDYPLPLVLINCGDGECRIFLESLKNDESKKRMTFERLFVDFHDTPEELKQKYMDAVLMYMKNCNVAGNFLFVNK